MKCVMKDVDTNNDCPAEPQLQPAHIADLARNFVSHEHNAQSIYGGAQSVEHEERRIKMSCFVGKTRTQQNLPQPRWHQPGSKNEQARYSRCQQQCGGQNRSSIFLT